MTDLFSPLEMKRGSDWKNRFMLAPLTNQQSYPDGILSDDEFNWLTKRAEGDFGLTMTCASAIRARGVGFPGQLGVYDDKHLAGLTRLASAINEHGSHSVVQLHHAGMRTPHDLIEGPPECPSDNEEWGAKALSLEQVENLKEDFIAGAKRAQAAGFHGVELHGAHGYILGQFLSAEVNQRDDKYGGSLENRSRILFDLIAAIREQCGENFSLGVRLSPERFGMQIGEIIDLAGQLLVDDRIDYLDMSLWDVFKPAGEDSYKDKSLLSMFTDLPRSHVKLGAAGKIMTASDARRAMDAGLDFVVIGRGAILHHNLPELVQHNADFEPATLPVSAAHLKQEGLSDTFVKYMRNWRGFVADDAVS
ncbi:MAG: NADH oxidase [Hyphomonas sp. TMED17]|nr:MAG: NADH oxidase [Hyphomonas sp. TMED17]